MPHAGRASRGTAGRSSRRSHPTARSGGSGRSRARSPTARSTRSRRRADRAPRLGTGLGPAPHDLAGDAEGPPRVRAWLRRPVAHLRDMRTEFLLKLELGAPAAELARAQLAAFGPAFAGLQRAAGPNRMTSSPAGGSSRPRPRAGFSTRSPEPTDTSRHDRIPRPRRVPRAARPDARRRRDVRRRRSGRDRRGDRGRGLPLPHRRAARRAGDLPPLRRAAAGVRAHRRPDVQVGRRQQRRVLQLRAGRPISSTACTASAATRSTSRCASTAVPTTGAGRRASSRT